MSRPIDRYAARRNFRFWMFDLRFIFDSVAGGVCAMLVSKPPNRCLLFRLPALTTPADALEPFFERFQVELLFGCGVFLPEQIDFVMRNRSADARVCRLPGAFQRRLSG